MPAEPRCLSVFRIALTLLAGLLAGPVSAAADGIPWRGWSDDLFVQARREHKLVLLDLQAVWCHWCHVMDEQTYRDSAVVALLRAHYLAVKVDQDSRPDLSNRYEDYGWPATIIYAPDGRELVKRSGYIPAPGMIALLQAVVDDPTPGPSIAPPATPDFSAAAITPALRGELEKLVVEQYDPEHGGWGFSQKFLDADSVEYALLQARRGDAGAAHRARQTLEAQRQLLDPVWGGVYQYSTGGDWHTPHFEKIMSMQANDLRVYALAWAQFHEPADLDAAHAIRDYLSRFLTRADGAFYASQDADLVPGEHAADYFALDDAARLARGIPRIDTHVYARENGWAIEALAMLYSASRAARDLDAATRAAQVMLEQRRLPGGGFRHDVRDPAGPYLGDTLAMGRAFLALYSATGDRAWLVHAQSAARFIAVHFANGAAPGYRTAASRRGAPPPQPLRDENIRLARFANRLHRYTGDAADRQLAQRAMRFIAAPEIARRFPASGALLADDELDRDPLHFTVVGNKDDPAAAALFGVAAAFPSAYTRIEWWDRREGPLPQGDVRYPAFPKAAAYVCTERSCSTPIFESTVLSSRLARMVQMP
ncbi:MAG: thioredoxin domain-containing protein [Nevskia sp.]